MCKESPKHNMYSLLWRIESSYEFRVICWVIDSLLFLDSLLIGASHWEEYHVRFKHSDTTIWALWNPLDHEMIIWKSLEKACAQTFSNNWWLIKLLQPLSYKMPLYYYQVWGSLKIMLPLCVGHFFYSTILSILRVHLLHKNGIWWINISIFSSFKLSFLSLMFWIHW